MKSIKELRIKAPDKVLHCIFMHLTGGVIDIENEKYIGPVSALLGLTEFELIRRLNDYSGGILS